MKPELAPLVWELPGARSFVRKNGQALREGISLFCLFLSRPDVGTFQNQLQQYLEQELIIKVCLIDLRRTRGGSPFEILQSLLPKHNSYQYLEQMVSDSALPAVVIVTHFEDRPNSEIQEWVQSLARWGEACRSSGSLNSLALLMPVDCIQQLQLPATDVRLAYSIWPGAPSALDVRILCRYISEDTDAEAQWREYLLASLSGNDLLLAEYLWDYVCEPIENILTALEHYRRDCHWSEEEIRDQLQNWRPIPAGQRLSSKQNANGINTICRGWTVYTPEYGEEIHAAILMLLGRRQEVIHRIWRAQAALMLPMIDDTRRRICSCLTARYGSKWAVIDNELFDSPLELGKLKYYFELLPDTSWEKRQWGRGILQIWHARNELAHYKPVSYTSFHDIWRLGCSVHGMLHSFS